MMSFRQLTHWLLSVSLGVGGGLIALLLHFPIPWMLGSLIACALARLGGLPVRSLPSVLERWMRVAIGVSLGPSVASSMQRSGADLPFAIAAALGVTTLTVVIGMPWFERLAKLPRPAAFLSALPGGLSMLLALAGDSGNRAEVLMVHACTRRDCCGFHFTTGPVSRRATRARPAVRQPGLA